MISIIVNVTHIDGYGMMNCSAEDQATYIVIALYQSCLFALQSPKTVADCLAILPHDVSSPTHDHHELRYSELEVDSIVTSRGLASTPSSRIQTSVRVENKVPANVIYILTKKYTSHAYEHYKEAITESYFNSLRDVYRWD